MQENQLEHIDRRVNNQAREWFTLMQSGSANQSDNEQLQEWLQESSTHECAYNQYLRIWQDLGNLHQEEKAALKRSVEPSWLESAIKHAADFISGLQALKAHTGIIFTSASIIFLGLVLITLKPTKIEAQYFSTATGELKKVILEDGSEVTLGAKSELKAWTTAKKRHAALISGQAFFKIAKNPQKPFFVNAGETEIRVVGTQFDVRRSADRARVAVLEGVVNVSSSNKNLAAVVLTAAQQVTHFNGGRFESVNSISTSELESWRHGRLFYLRANLADVVADANRYFKQSIILGSQDLAELKITAAVSTKDIDGLMDMLTSSLPVVAHKDSQNNIVIVSRKQSNKIAPQ